MILIESIFGTKCRDCGCRIKGTKFEIALDTSDAGSQWLCSGCYQAREAVERFAREAAEKRRRDENERWRAFPDRQVESELPRIVEALKLNLDETPLADLKHFCQHAENHWRGEKIQWRTRLNAEKWLIGALSSPTTQVRVFAARLLGIAGFVDSAPALISLVGAKDDSSLAARSAIAAVLERLGRGDSTCPRCGYEVNDDGNGTNWRCSKCDLAHQRSSSHNPASFRANRSFKRSPWNRCDFQELLEDVVVVCDGASGERIREWSLRAKQIAAERDYLLVTLGQG